MLDKVQKARDFYNVLDLGTGSGVLAIAVAKSMPCYVLATEIDPVATETARANSHNNSVQCLVECLTSAGFQNRRLKEQGPYDLVLANILAKPLQSMARDICQNTANGGTVILSGLLPHQRAPLVSRFRQQGLHLRHWFVNDGWLVLAFHKP